MNLSPEQLQALAERLGYASFRVNPDGGLEAKAFSFDVDWEDMSYGELLLAIMSRAAAEMNREVNITNADDMLKEQRVEREAKWMVSVEPFWDAAPTLLEAAILAFIQLPHMSNADSKSMTGEG